MNNIRLDFDGLRASKQRIMDVHSSIEESLRTLDQVINNDIPTQWEGQSANAYQEQYAAARPTIVNLQQNLETVAAQIDQVIDAQSNLDNDMASQLQ